MSDLSTVEVNTQKMKHVKQVDLNPSNKKPPLCSLFLNYNKVSETLIKGKLGRGLKYVFCSRQTLVHKNKQVFSV